MLEFVFLGLIQGLLEWLPVSSEGFLVIASSLMGIPEALDLALYLHLGTLFGVIIYFRKKIKSLIAKPRKQGVFIGKTTIVSLLVGFPIYLGVDYLSETAAEQAGGVLLALTGVALVATGFMLKKKSNRKGGQYTNRDALYAGVLQGLAAIPGFSRSGSTMFALLSSGYEQEEALETSFLMSIPVVLAVVAYLCLKGFAFQQEYLVALAVAFVVGMLSIHFLLTLAKKMNFSWFCWIFGMISLGAFLFLHLASM